MSTVRRVLLGLGAIMLLSFGAGAVSGVIRRWFPGDTWSDDGIRGAKAGCIKLGGPEVACDCYAATVSKEVTWSDFLRMSADASEGRPVAPEKVALIRRIATNCGLNP